MKKLLDLDICGFPYKVYQATDRQCPPLRNAEGVTDSRNCAIYLRADLHKSRTKDVLLHEIMHALFEGSGVRFKLYTFLKSDDLAELVEEESIRALTPHLIGILRQLKGVF